MSTLVLKGITLICNGIHPNSIPNMTKRFFVFFKYIERRFRSKWLRKATVVLTLGGAYLFIGFLLFPPALFLQDFTGLNPLQNMIITGITCSIYSSFVSDLQNSFEKIIFFDSSIFFSIGRR